MIYYIVTFFLGFFLGFLSCSILCTSKEPIDQDFIDEEELLNLTKRKSK